MGRYLIEEGEKANEILDGASLYAPPWDLVRGSRYFYENMGGLYAKGMGLKLNNNTLHLILPEMKPYMTDQEYKYYEKVLQTNKTGLDHIDEKVYAPMFGYKNAEDYY